MNKILALLCMTMFPSIGIAQNCTNSNCNLYILYPDYPDYEDEVSFSINYMYGASCPLAGPQGCEDFCVPDEEQDTEGCALEWTVTFSGNYTTWCTNYNSNLWLHVRPTNNFTSGTHRCNTCTDIEFEDYFYWEEEMTSFPFSYTKEHTMCCGTNDGYVIWPHTWRPVTSSQTWCFPMHTGDGILTIMCSSCPAPIE